LSTGDTELSRTPPSVAVLAQTLAQRRMVHATLCQGVNGSIPRRRARHHCCVRRDDWTGRVPTTLCDIARHESQTVGHCSSWCLCKRIGPDPGVRHDSHSALKSVVQALHSYDHPRFLLSSTNLLDLAAERASLSKASLAPSRLAQHSVAVPAHHDGLSVAEDRGAVKKEKRGNASVGALRRPRTLCD
jgi:hypothetical protein